MDPPHEPALRRRQVNVGRGQAGTHGLRIVPLTRVRRIGLPPPRGERTSCQQVVTAPTARLARPALPRHSSVLVVMVDMSGNGHRPERPPGGHSHLWLSLVQSGIPGRSHTGSPRARGPGQRLGWLERTRRIGRKCHLQACPGRLPPERVPGAGPRRDAGAASDAPLRRGEPCDRPPPDGLSGPPAGLAVPVPLRQIPCSLPYGALPWPYLTISSIPDQAPLCTAAAT